MAIEFTLGRAVIVAQTFMNQSAKLTDYRVSKNKRYSKHNRKMRRLARELSAGKGYIIAKDEDFNRRFGEYLDKPIMSVGSSRRLHLWTICYNDYYDRVEFMPVR